MAESFKSMATCGCGSVGDVVEKSDRLDAEPWFVIQHQGEVKHTNVRVKVDDRFKLALKP